MENEAVKRIDRKKMKSKRILALVIFVFSIALSIAFFVFQDYFKSTVSLGLLGLFILNFATSASLFISAPSIFAVVAGGAIYAPWQVAIVSSLGSAFGDMVGFLLGLSGRHLANHKLHKKIWFNVFTTYFKKYGGLLILILAFIPNPLFDSIGIIAGVFAYSAKKFFLFVFIGRLIRYFLLATFGSIL